jgi:predicted membrane protein (TIGR00267 family)
MDEANGPRRRLAQQVENVREYSRIAGVGEIARRYFAMNAFDGVLTTIGVLMGNYLAGVRDVTIPIRTGIATSIAMGVSGLWGAYLTEAAERQRELTELEKACLVDQSDTKIGRASRLAVLIVSLVDGLAPFLAALLVLVPLFLATIIGNVVTSYVLSIVTALLALFGLGMFLGHVSKRSLIGYGLRTLVAGIVAIGLNFVLDGPRH